MRARRPPHSTPPAVLTPPAPAADKNALRTQLKVNMLRIRERELLFFTNNCLSISTSAVPPPARGCRLPRGECTHLNTHSTRAQALLAGFAWYGLTEVPFDLGADVVRALASPRPRVDVRTAPSACPRAVQVIQTLYLVVTTLIMGLELLTVVNATLCAILGPGLALRGPDGSMHNAVNGMMTHYKFTFACFTAGLLCFHISALLYAWMQFDWDLARTPSPTFAPCPAHTGNCTAGRFHTIGGCAVRRRSQSRCCSCISSGQCAWPHARPAPPSPPPLPPSRPPRAGPDAPLL